MKRTQGDKDGTKGNFSGSLSLPHFVVPRRQAGKLAGGNEKIFYKIGEVSVITGLEPYVIRYWETEFPILHPRKSRGGQRIYLKKDLENILRIKQMLYDEGFTISGARRVLARKSSDASSESRGMIVKLRTDLAEILHIVSSSTDSHRTVNRHGA